MVKHSEGCSAGNGGVAAVEWGGLSALCGQQAARCGHWGWRGNYSSSSVMAGDCVARNRTGID